MPIFLTANDLSRLYAPLARRLDSFYYEPTREEAAEVHAAYGQLAAGQKATY